MNVKTLKQAILLCREARVTPFIWGHRGVGKSSIVKQVAAEHNLGFVDFRASQIEASDLRGLPDKESGRTVFRPPADMPLATMTWEEGQKKIRESGDKKWETETQIQPFLENGILFLDELNRAQDDVIQAAFQLVLDRRVGQYVLPPGWCVVVAGNYMEGYQTNGFTDPAFINRFAHLVMSDDDSTIDEWVAWMVDMYGQTASTVIEFATQNLKHLNGDVKGDLGFPIQPSRRSWEMVVRITNAFETFNNSKSQLDQISEGAKIEVIAGLVGAELARTYTRYNCPVRPRDLMQDGVEKHKTKLRSLNRNQMMGLMWGLSGFLKGKIDQEKSGKVAVDFLRFLLVEGETERDVAVAFCSVMNSDIGSDMKERMAFISNPSLAKMFSKFRGPNQKKKFIDLINEDQELQALLSKCAWGKGNNE